MLIVALLIAIVFSLMVASLVVFHSYLAVNNLTTCKCHVVLHTHTVANFLQGKPFPGTRSRTCGSGQSTTGHLSTADFERTYASSAATNSACASGESGACQRSYPRWRKDCGCERAIGATDFSKSCADYKQVVQSPSKLYRSNLKESKTG